MHAYRLNKYLDLPMIVFGNRKHIRKRTKVTVALPVYNEDDNG